MVLSPGVYNPYDGVDWDEVVIDSTANDLLGTYAGLSYDWDGYGAEVLDTEALIYCTRFYLLLQNNIRNNRALPMAYADGRVSLYWMGEEEYLEIEFMKGDTFFWCSLPTSGNHRGGEGLSREAWEDKELQKTILEIEALLPWNNSMRNMSAYYPLNKF